MFLFKILKWKRMCSSNRITSQNLSSKEYVTLNIVFRNFLNLKQSDRLPDPNNNNHYVTWVFLSTGLCAGDIWSFCDHMHVP